MPKAKSFTTKQKEHRQYQRTLLTIATTINLIPWNHQHQFEPYGGQRQHLIDIRRQCLRIPRLLNFPNQYSAPPQGEGVGVERRTPFDTWQESDEMRVDIMRRISVFRVCDMIAQSPCPTQEQVLWVVSNPGA